MFDGFFFFKQKTAYEMRISDWSSDVCSSDLLFEAMMSTNRTSFVPALHSPVNSETGEMFVLPPIPLEVFATTNPYGIGHMWVKRVFIDQIGRASCRVRVCQYV